MRFRGVEIAWVEAFNPADAETLTNFYRQDAINHQVAEELVKGGIQGV